MLFIRSIEVQWSDARSMKDINTIESAKRTKTVLFHYLQWQKSHLHHAVDIYIDVGIITPTRGVYNAATLWEYNNYRISACQEVCQTLMEAYSITLSPELI